MDMIKDSGSYSFSRESVLRIAKFANFFLNPKMEGSVPSAICYKWRTIPSLGPHLRSKETLSQKPLSYCSIMSYYPESHYMSRLKSVIDDGNGSILTGLDKFRFHWLKLGLWLQWPLLKNLTVANSINCSSLNKKDDWMDTMQITIWVGNRTSWQLHSPKLRYWIFCEVFSSQTGQG